MSLTMTTRPLIAWRWLGVPAVLSVLATVLLAAPISLFGLRPPEPVFPLALSFAWAVIRPSILAPFVLLLLGLFLDMFWGGPPGLWAVTLLVPYSLALGGRGMLSSQGPAMTFVGYVVTIALAFAAACGLCVMNNLGPPSPIALFWQFLATTLLYPLVIRLIERFEDADVRFR